MKKNDALYLAEESTYKIAATLVEVYHHPSTTAEAKDDIIAGANIINKTINALNSAGTTNNTTNIIEELEKYKDNQGHSRLLTKIKEFIKSIISLFTSRSTTRNVEEVRKSTDDTIQEIVASKDDKADQKSTSPLPSIANHSSAQATTEPRVRSASVSSAPPSPPSTPPPLIRAHTFPIVGDRGALMEAIRGGVQLKNVSERKSPDNTVTTLQDPQTSVIDELTRRLKARRAKSGDNHEITAPSSKFTEDAKLFEQARREEAERQARIEQSENIRVAAAKAAEKKDKISEIKSRPIPINLKPGEIPPPPPPPPPPSPASPQANNAVKSPLQATKGSGNHVAKSLQVPVTQKELEEVRQKLRKRTVALDTSRQEADAAHINFQSVVKKKQKLRPNKGYNK